MIRFIHCADIHLGRTFQTSTDMSDRFIQEAVRSTYDSFEKIVKEAISKNVDFILISGDVYDQKQRSIRGQWFIKKQAEKLLKYNIQVFMIHGNHDPLLNERQMIGMPENVFIFSTEVSHKEYVTSQGEKVIIYGFSYPESAFTENPTPHYKKVENTEAYHIGLLHGQEKGQQGHDAYAPFTVHSLEEKGFDYWALGHIHQRQVLRENPPIVYSGNIQGCHRKETGAKGAYYVELSPSESQLQFIETSPIRWEHHRLSISELQTINELVEEFNETVKTSKEKRIVMVTIEGSGILHDKLSDQRSRQEIITFLYEEWTDDDISIDRIVFDTLPNLQREVWKQQDHLLGDVIRLREEMETDESLSEVLSPLFSHHKIRSYLNDLTVDEHKEIIEKAERMILTTLLEEGKET
ncbi:metallophosphoesterase family protein [Salipaludibacillus sp. HK11]|uniref:metallophosphoesterase family protein n=1 Tax=Salipaludibacillus sp. HK11 TaxID=3394320 RepID=UPI0039FBC661